MLQQDDLMMQKIELTLDMQNKKVLAELAKVREEISSLREEVAALKKARPAPQPVQPRPQEKGFQPAAAAPAAPQAEESHADRDKPIDRNGVAPSDVSIEKMFYFGNKKH